MCPRERGGGNPDKMTIPSLGALCNASIAAASAAARAVDRPGLRDAHAYAVLIREVSAYNARPRMQQGSNVLTPPPRPSIPPPPAACAWQRSPTTSFLGSTFGIANNDNTKDVRAKNEREGMGDGDQAQHMT